METGYQNHTVGTTGLMRYVIYKGCRHIHDSSLKLLVEKQIQSFCIAITETDHGKINLGFLSSLITDIFHREVISVFQHQSLRMMYIER